MDAPFARELFGWRVPDGKNKQKKYDQIPNCADADNEASIALAGGMLDALGLYKDSAPEPPPQPGSKLEKRVRDDVQRYLEVHNGHKRWTVGCNRLVTDFVQYRHLKDIDDLVKGNPSLRVTLTQDYLIKPDVTVGAVNPETPEAVPFLHAAVSCKWTVGSDEGPNLRHDFMQLVLHRNGRQPHLVAVTAEPLPSRLASISCGEGEVDCVYHIAYDALGQAIFKHVAAEEERIWKELVAQDRVQSYEEMLESLAWQ